MRMPGAVAVVVWRIWLLLTVARSIDAAEAAPGAWLYQLSDAGLAAELTVQGTKYFKDPNLN